MEGYKSSSLGLFAIPNSYNMILDLSEPGKPLQDLSMNAFTSPRAVISVIVKKYRLFEESRKRERQYKTFKANYAIELEKFRKKLELHDRRDTTVMERLEEHTKSLELSERSDVEAAAAEPREDIGTQRAITRESLKIKGFRKRLEQLTQRDAAAKEELEAMWPSYLRAQRSIARQIMFYSISRKIAELAGARADRRIAFLKSTTLEQQVLMRSRKISELEHAIRLEILRPVLVLLCWAVVILVLIVDNMYF